MKQTRVIVNPFPVNWFLLDSDVFVKDFQDIHLA